MIPVLSGWTDQQRFHVGADAPAAILPVSLTRKEAFG